MSRPVWDYPSPSSAAVTRSSSHAFKLPATRSSSHPCCSRTHFASPRTHLPALPPMPALNLPSSPTPSNPNPNPNPNRTDTTSLR